MLVRVYRSTVTKLKMLVGVWIQVISSSQHGIGLVQEGHMIEEYINC